MFRSASSRPRAGAPLLASWLAIGLLSSGCTALGVDRLAPEPATPGWLESAREDVGETLTLVSWNAQKGRDTRFGGDLARLVARERPDLLFLQEARRELGRTAALRGFFARSWHYPWPGGQTVGVLTLSSLPSRVVKALHSRHRELWVTPKLSLVSEHELGGEATLLAANVHLLNFQRWSTAQMREQLADVAALFARHDGPVLLAGDFNAWSPDRQREIEALAAGLHLVEVTGFPAGRRTGDQGAGWVNGLLGVDPALPLDRVYYRDLTLREAAVLDYASSDHRPLRVTFATPTPSG